MENPTATYVGVRPRQSKLKVVSGVMNVTPFSREKFRVVTVPEPLKSIVMA